MPTLRKDGVGSESSFQKEELGRQYRASTITDILVQARTIIGGLEKYKALIKKIGRGVSQPQVEQMLICFVKDSSEILRLLIDANWRSDDRAVDCEDRLGKLEQRMQELEKRLPADARK